MINRFLAAILAFSFVFSSFSIIADNRQNNKVLESAAINNEVYIFSEDYGETVSDTPISYVFRITFFSENGKLKAKYDIDGFQTMSRFICFSNQTKSSYDFYFESYGEEDMFKSDLIKKGQLMFRIIEKNDKLYISNFSSPVDGEVVNKEYELEKVKNKQ